MRKVLPIVLGVGVVLCGAGGWFAYRAYDLGTDIAESSITQAEFDTQQLGGAETTVRDALPVPLKDIDERDLYGTNDPTEQGKPAGASCVYYMVKPLTEGKGRPMFRFCFAGGKLTEKKQIRVVGE
ncbi:hypothetical protein [Actinoplanes sp. NBRC 103695]|uniref:hypothetical protein n=1 Tax=Actinoplanes sp. NBRC 103695 TaxID=3032202 RepID=UPI0024A29192|nr:hypothetical protein [Actinoplanes sp. NBRC 103695]GLY97529.1 hypothetical protein Acsp02_47830 [Actinoplanes sp. NBRC 103695]